MKYQYIYQNKFQSTSVHGECRVQTNNNTINIIDTVSDYGNTKIRNSSL